jgi:hypothetical protein
MANARFPGDKVPEEVRAANRKTGIVLGVFVVGIYYYSIQKMSKKVRRTCTFSATGNLFCVILARTILNLFTILRFQSITIPPFSCCFCQDELDKVIEAELGTTDPGSKV